MFKRSRTLTYIALMLSALVLSGCGGSDIESGTDQLLTCQAPNVPNAAGDACEPPPPISCEPPTVPNKTNDACVVGVNPELDDPVVLPGANQAVLYFNRIAEGATNDAGDESYDGYRLHDWNDDTCAGYAEPRNNWADGRVHNGIDPNYGAYWLIELVPGYAEQAGACLNFIIHVGTDDAGKQMGGGNAKAPLDQQDAKFARVNFTFPSSPTVYEFPILSLGSQPVKIEGQAAHWLDANTLLWDVEPGTTSAVKLHHSAAADLVSSLETGLNGSVLPLMQVELTDEQKAIAPHLAHLPAFQGEWSSDDAKAVMRGQAVLAGYSLDKDNKEQLSSATGIQLANALDQLYTLGEDDANEAQFGPIYNEDGSITLAVWAPTAQQVSLKLYNGNKTLSATQAMTRDDASGVWRYTGGSELNRAYYRYEVTVYHPKAEGMQTLLVTDPYSVSLSTNSRFSQVVNLADDDLKPEGWDEHAIPTIENWEDAVIYEGHIRNFSARDESTSMANRGKYMAFTEEGTAPTEHLKKLAQSGVTHFHMLPANDIATIEEDVSKTVNFDSTFAELCALNGGADICDDASIDATIKLGDLFASFDPLSEGGKAQELAQAMRGVDQFNWGYDPLHFNTPEGSYSSNPEGVTRIKEMRAMNMALHGMGLRTVLDVVYNHTNASELNAKSVLDKVVPGYYHRYRMDDGSIVRETCCDDTEPRNAMMEKLMLDSLLLWTEHYKFDGFRFDIMSQASKDTMLRLWGAVKAVDADNYFYGEGWGKDAAKYGYGAFEEATQFNMAGTQIGTFNDRIREAVRLGDIFAEESSDDALYQQDRVKMSLAATLSDYPLTDRNGSVIPTSSLGGYAMDPADNINYVSKHDGYTLWDQLNLKLPADLTLEQRVRVQNMAQSIPLMAQGIPFLQMGGDFLRSKSMDKDSYDSGDWFNYVDFTYNYNNWNVGLPLAEKNAGDWGTIGKFINLPDRAASMTEIEFAAMVFDEMLQVRASSKLFRLTTGQQIKNRLGFHNIGKRQTQGLIVMSIDDGNTEIDGQVLADLDPGLDALVVVINSGYQEQSITVNTATGFALHSLQANSVDPSVRNASFTEGEGDDQGNGTFTVPALTTAVFVKQQMGEQGYGLAATSTSGAPDVPPYKETTVFVRGSLNSWGETDVMAYMGGGVYSANIELAPGDYEFKVASADWSTVDFGSAEQDVTLGEGKTLSRGGANLKLTISEQTTYKFSLNASDSEAPVLTVDYEEPFYGTTVYVRGSLNGWGEANPMSYETGGQYTAVMSLVAGDYEFKLASADWSTVDYGSGEGTADIAVGQEKLLAVSGANLQMTIENDGDYIFVFNTANLAEPTVSVFNAQMFGETTVFIRGSINGWGEVDSLVYQGNGVYSTDIAIDAGEYEFKVASADWSTVDFGAVGDDTVVTLGQPKALGSKGANLKLSISESATYRFSVKGPDPSNPQVTVSVPE